eukprot:429103-Amorphochlora_amoeboformis.AAC.1
MAIASEAPLRLFFALGVAVISPIAVVICFLSGIPTVGADKGTTIPVESTVLDLTCDNWKALDTSLLVGATVVGPAFVLTMISLLFRGEKKEKKE